MDILKIFRMQEPVSKELLTKTETGKIKPTSSDKDTPGSGQSDKIKELEQKITELEQTNKQLVQNRNGDTSSDIEFQKIMRAYEKFISKLLLERQQILDQKNTAQNHLANLEVSFSDLLEKYERAKTVVEGYKNNEVILKRTIKKYEDYIEQMNKKYLTLKLEAESKLAQANLELNKNGEVNIQEIAKLKAKILQGQAKITELEKYVKFEDVCSRPSMFAPLQTNIIKQK